MADESQLPAPTLIYIVGPPAVGKMTVGQAIETRTGLRVFHNHLSIDPVLRFFEFGSPPFSRLVSEFRARLFEEVATSDLPGVIFTYVWDFDTPGDEQELQAYARPFHERGGRVLYVELEASQSERLQRNEHADRLAAKPTKRDLEASRRNLLDLDAQYRLNSAGQFDGRADYLRIDNTYLSPAEVADQVVRHFRLNPIEPDAEITASSLPAVTTN